MKGGRSVIAAYVLLGALLVSLWVGIASPIVQWRDQMLADATTAEVEAVRLRAAKNSLTREKLALSEETNEDLFWRAAQVGEAYAKVQSNVSSAATENGVSLRTATPLPAQSSGGVETIAVRVEFEADLGQLTGFLRAIEFNSPTLPIQRANLRRVIRANDLSALPTMFVQIDISAPVLMEDGS